MVAAAAAAGVVPAAAAAEGTKTRLIQASLSPRRWQGRLVFSPGRVRAPLTGPDPTLVGQVENLSYKGWVRTSNYQMQDGWLVGCAHRIRPGIVTTDS